MDKSMHASNYKVSNHIPDDLAFFILLKLPLKSLKRFESVCKSWSLLFECPNFMRMYGINFLSKSHACYDDTSLLLFYEIFELTQDWQQYRLYSISRDRFENKVKLDWPNSLQEDYEFGYDIVGHSSINGILCLFHIYREELTLWNPATMEFKVIPQKPIESKLHTFENYAFGYDCVRDDYKVIRYTRIFLNPDNEYKHLRDSSDSLWEIYSLRRSSWKMLDINVPRSGYYEPVFLDGVGHWKSKNETENEPTLVSFDFSNETTVTTPIPSDIIGENLDHTYLVVLNGSISLIRNYAEITTFQISILGEVGVKDSWTKLFVIGPLPCIQFLGAWKNGDIFFINDNDELARFDLSTHTIEKLDIIIEDSFCNARIVIYKESFLSIGGISD